MKRTCGLFFLIVMAQTVLSQDLIVTQEDAQLNCKITKLSSKEILFIFIQDGVVKDSSLSRQSIKEYKFDRFAVNDTLIAFVKKTTNQNKYHYRVALNLGLGYLINLYPDDASDDLAAYYMNLKSGSQVSGDVTYYFSGGLGVGFKYGLFNTKNSALVFNQSQVQTGIMSDNLSITFIGPSVSTRFPTINGNNGLILDFSLGYMKYTDNVVLESSYLEKGNTLGYSLGLGYDFSISKNMAIGIQLSMYTGRLTEYDKTNSLGTTTTIQLDKDSYKKLERLDLSVGFRFLK
jgi:hypothetical protein